MRTGIFPFVTVLFIAILGWMVVGLVFSRMSSWASLAQRYRYDEPFSGELLRFRSAAMRFGGHFRSCLTMGVNPQGFFLALSFPFFPGHPPLFIPWNDITVHRTRFLWVKGVELDLGREPAIPLRLSERLATKLAALPGQAWPLAGRAGDWGLGARGDQQWSNRKYYRTLERDSRSR